MVLADDHLFLRRNLRSVLDGDPRAEVVGEADDLAGAFEHVRADHPDVLVLGVPGGTGMESVRHLRDQSPATHVVVTSMTDDPRYAREALDAGASAFVLKDYADRDLAEAVERAAVGQTFVSESVTPAADGLSERETEVLRLIALGHTNVEVAALLHVSLRTVETVRAHASRKVGANTRADLVRYALRHGLMDLPAA